MASGDDLNAMWSNPATLFRSKGLVVVWGDLGLINLDTSFKREESGLVSSLDDRYPSGFPKVTSSVWFPDPALAIGSDFGLRQWMFVLGVYGPYAGATRWPDDDPRCGPGQSASACATQCYQDPGSCSWNLGPQRYSLIEPERSLLHYQATAAFRPMDRLAVGAGIFLASFMMRERMKISAYPGIFGWAEDPALDALIELKANDYTRVGAVLGVWGQPLPYLELGLAFSTPLEVRAKGTLSVRLPSHYYFGDVTVTGDKIAVEMSFPMVLRAGARYLHPSKLFDLELQLSWEHWSTHRAVVVRPRETIQFTDVPGLGAYRVKAFTVRESYNDTVSLHLGGSVKAYRELLELRAGYFFELGAIPDRTYGVQTIDGDKHCAALGVSLQRWGLRLDVTYAFVHLMDRTVTRSEKRQVNPLYEEDTGPYVDGRPTIIGNGRYQARYHIVAASLSYRY